MLPGVAGLLRRLDATGACCSGCSPGNIEEGARIKLAPTGLRPYFRTGAFGSDDGDRRRLPSLAARRAQALTGHAFRAEDVLVIGDTPHDIDCARAFGAVAVAVATGLYPPRSWRPGRPDLLFDSFADAETAAKRLLAC